MILIIDGVVGSGKTTLAKKLSEKTNIPLYEELLDEDTLILLKNFYENKKRWSFTLQVHFLNKRLEMIEDIQKTGSGILDRSIYGDKIFAELLYENSDMNLQEYNTYNSLFNRMVSYTQKPDNLIYIDCDVNTAVERIQKRNREMELNTPINYWMKLNEKYTKWYNEYNISDKISLNVKEYDFLEGDIDEIIKKIKI